MLELRIILATVPRFAKPRLNDFFAQEVNGQRIHAFRGLAYKDPDEFNADGLHVARKLGHLYDLYHGAIGHATIAPDAIDWHAAFLQQAREVDALREELERLKGSSAPVKLTDPSKKLPPTTKVEGSGDAGPGTPGPAPAPPTTTPPTPEPAPAAGPSPGAPASRPAEPDPVKAAGTITPPAPAAEKPPTCARRRAAKKAAKVAANQEPGTKNQEPAAK